MIKIWLPPRQKALDKFNLMFDLENFKNYQRVDNMEDAKVVFLEGLKVLKERLPNCKLIVLDDLLNATEKHWEEYTSDLKKFVNWVNPINVLYITSYHGGYEGVLDLATNFDIIHYDVIFNRTKAYYSQFPFKSVTRHRSHPWYWAGQNAYRIENYTKPSKDRNKIFMHCSRIRPQRISFARAAISNFVSQYANKGYYNQTIINDHKLDLTRENLANQPRLWSHSDDPLRNGELYFDTETKSIRQNSETEFFASETQGYNPPHVNYYEDSYLTIISETIEFGGSSFISEKTLDPLIHGHLIFPFSNAGFCSHLLKQGFLLPSQIDYSYDTIEDDQQRLKVFLSELTKLLNHPKAWWEETFDATQDIRIHNQQLFWRKPYSEFVDSLLKALLK